jgi:DNA-directed RNA polymerase subunit beta'
MAFNKRDNRPRPTFSKITIGLASPDSIWKKALVKSLSLKPSTIVRTSLKEMVCSAKGFLVL